MNFNINSAVRLILEICKKVVRLLLRTVKTLEKNRKILIWLPSNEATCNLLSKLILTVSICDDEDKKELVDYNFS